MTLSIGEVSTLTGLTTHTLRFYEQERLFRAPVRRDSAGRRVFTQDEVEWLRVCVKLRESGMPLPEIEHKVEIYLKHLDAGTADKLWLSGPQCD